MTRLIDADALWNDIAAKAMVVSGRDLNKNEILDLIANAPTVQREGWVSDKQRTAEANKRIAELEGEVAELTRKCAERDLRFRSCDAYAKELQASNNDLREALEETTIRLDQSYARILRKRLS